MFTPDSADGGTVTITAGRSQAVVVGSGVYTIVANDDAADDGELTLTRDTSSCVDVSGVCTGNTTRLALTPIP